VNSRLRALAAAALLSLAAVASGAGSAQETKPAPDERARSEAAAPADYSTEPYVLEDATTKIVFENDGTATRESLARIRIQSDAALKQLGVLAFHYQSSFESIDSLSVRVRKPDGTVIETPSENVQDMPAEVTRQAPFYSDLREKHISVKALGVGDVLESRAVWRQNHPLVPGQFWFAYSFVDDAIVLHEQLAISGPRDRAVLWKSRTLQPVTAEAGGRKTWTWTTSHLKQKTDEEKKADAPAEQYLAIRGKRHVQDVMLSTFKSWEELGAWYREISKDRIAVSPEIRAKAAELTKGAADEDAKIRALYRFVGTQVRYIGVAFGIGRYQPHRAAEVLANQYGDCKDKHTLLASLLSAIGVTAYPALISPTHDLEPDVPSPSQFEHLVTAIPRGDRILWLDTTPEVAAFGYLIPSLRGKSALVVGDKAAARFEKTDADPPIRGSVTFRIDALLDDQGVLDGKIERTVRGDDQEAVIRAAFRSVPQNQWKDLVQLISQQTGFAGDVSDAVASDPANLDVPMRWTYRYKRKDYPDWSNRRLSEPLPPITMPASDEKAKSPIWLGAPADWLLQSVVALPKGSSPQVPPRVDLSEKFAEYHSSRSVEGGSLTTEKRVILKSREIDPEDGEAYGKFVKAIQEDQNRWIELAAPVRVTSDNYVQAIWLLPGSQNAQAESAFADARAAYERMDLPGIVSALRRAVSMDPSYTRARLALAEFLRLDRKSQQALTEFRAALDHAPREPLTYKILAFNLERSGKHAEAIETWKRLIELAPQDPDAASGLARTLAGARRYKEAVGALQSAVDRDGNRADLQLQLLAAAARAGDATVASAARKRAMELDPSPNDLNTTAYDLADAGIQLSAALELSERAVHELETSTAKTTLEDLSMSTVLQPALLAAFWDTQGWVLYKLGRLDRAEKYLAAAWAVSQRPTIGDHLGQLAEKRNRPADALRMYRLALAAQPSGATDEKTAARLKRLETGQKTSGRYFNAREEMTRIRSYRVEGLSTDDATAEVFLLIGPRGQPLAVKLLRGAPEPRGAAKALKDLRFAELFPSDGPARQVRRGLLACASGAGCTLTLYMPDQVRSVD